MAENPTPALTEELLASTDWLRALARRLVGDVHLADDLVQETVIAAIDRPPPRALTRGWLATVLRNLAWKSRRSDRRRAAREERATTPGSSISVPELCARAETQRELTDLVLGLAPIYRDVILLRYFRGLPLAETAAALDVPVETVRTRNRRALRQLRSELDDRRGGRRAWVLLFTGIFGRTTRPAAPAGTAALGGIMAAKGKTMAVISVVVVLMATAAVVLLDPFSAAAPDPDLRVGPLPNLSGSGAGDVDAEPSPATGVDFATIDREHDLHGRVVDSAGDAISGATVAAERFPVERVTVLISGVTSTTVPAGTTRTAPDGTWKLTLPRRIAARLTVTAPGFAGALVENVQAGERIDVVLRPAARLTVVVRDEHGNPVPGANVRTYTQRDVQGRSIPLLEGLTDDTGHIAFEGLPRTGTLTIDTTHPRLGSLYYHEEVLEGAAEVTVNLDLPTGRTLRGRIVDARTGDPVAGARVGRGWFFEAEVRTDADGVYVLPGWTGVGLYEIGVEAEGYAAAEALVGDREIIDVRLVRGISLSGRIVDSEKQPLSGVRIAAVGSSRETGRQETSAGSAVSGEDGTFTIDGLRHDLPHTLVLLAPGRGRTLYDMASLGKPGENRDLGDLRVHSAWKIEGRVLSDEDVAAGRVRVRLIGANADRGRFVPDQEPPDHGYGSRAERLTDDLGRFHFGELAPGAYTLRARLDGGREIEQMVELGEADATVDLRFRAGRRLTVILTDTAGLPVAGAGVRLWLGNGSPLRVVTDRDGRSVFQAHRPVREAEVDVPNGFLEIPRVVVPDGAEEVKIVLVPAGRASGIVVDADGNPISRAILRAVLRGETVSEGFARRDGTFSIRVPIGETVRVELTGEGVEDMGTSWMHIDLFVSGALEGVTAGEKSLRLVAKTVARDRSLGVRVLAPDGTPVPGSRVLVNGMSGMTLTSDITDGAGRVKFAELPAALLKVIALRPEDQEVDWVLPDFFETLPDGQEIVSRFRRPDPIRGTVVDSRGAPVGGAWVEAEYGANRTRAQADAEGRFTLRVAEGADPVLVRANLDPGAGLASPVVRSRAGTTTLRLVIPTD